MIEDIKLTPGELIINNTAKLINSKVINMSNDLDKELDFQNSLQIDEVKYRNYLDQYLKIPNSPDFFLYKILSRYFDNRKT